MGIVQIQMWKHWNKAEQKLLLSFSSDVVFSINSAPNKNHSPHTIIYVRVFCSSTMHLSDSLNIIEYEKLQFLYCIHTVG